jgi:pimeloyl-ACP methyl ester carboxylesterase
VQGVVIRNAGHWLMEEAPADTMAALTQFVDAPSPQ